MTREELIEFLNEALGICGCSDADGAVGFLKDLLEAGEMRDQGHTTESEAVLAEMMPQGDCLERNLPIYWINSAGLTEHGYSLDQFGLSELGDLVLASIRAYGTDDELWNEMAAPAPENKGMLN
jgi:hypothetical protein